MKNKVAVNTKYFTKSQAKGIRSHVKRELQNDVNVVDERLTQNNFGTKSEAMDRNYELALKLMPQSVKNSLIDSVLVLPLDQVKKVQEEHPTEWKKKLNQSIVSMMKEMEEELGFMPIGYKMHLDEGTPDPETGEVKLNPHAHLQFANVCTKDITLTKTKKVTLKGEDGKALRDPKKPNKYLYELDENGKPKTEVVNIPLKGRAPLSLHQTRGKDSAWAKQQDIAAKHLKHLGFERGDSKELTNARHLSKSQHIERVLSEKEKKVEAATHLLNVKYGYLKSLENMIQREEKEVEKFIHTREEYYDSLKSGSVLSLDGKMKKSIQAANELSPAVKNVVLNESIERSEAIMGTIEPSDDVALENLKGYIVTLEDESKKVENNTPNTRPRIKL